MIERNLMERWVRTWWRMSQTVVVSCVEEIRIWVVFLEFLV